MFFLITKRALCQKVQFTLSSVTLRYLIRKLNKKLTKKCNRFYTYRKQQRPLDDLDSQTTRGRD